MKRKNSIFRYISLIITIVTVLFTTSCSGTSSWPIFGANDGKTSSDTTAFTTRVHTGLYGIEMRFVDNQLPSTVYWTGNALKFPIMLEVRNRGATNVMGTMPNEAYIYLTGYDKNIISPTLSPTSSLKLYVSSKFSKSIIIPVTLDAISNFNPEGGYTVAEFENAISNWPAGTDVYEPTFRATACYNYETEATPVLCIDPHPFSAMDEKKVCRPQNVALAGGQGGPIEVTSVEEEVTEGMMYVKIHIQNSQSAGQVFDKDHVTPESTDGSCPNLQYKYINKVYYITPYFPSNEANTQTGTVPYVINNGCKPESPIRLVNNAATIYCQFAIPQTIQDAYQSPLTIKLQYGYMNYIERKITIKNAANN